MQQSCAEDTAVVNTNTDKAMKRKFIKRKKVDVSFQHASV